MSKDIIALSIGTILVLTVVYKVLKCIFDHLSLRQRLSAIPGPNTLPFIGMILELRKIPLNDTYWYMKKICFEYKGGILVTWIGTEPSVHIRKPHQLEVVLKSQTLISKPEIYSYLSSWLGNGLLTSTGDLWHRNRRMLTPTLHFTILDEYINIISEKAVIFNECIAAAAKSNPKGLVNIFPLAINFTLDSTCETIMGVDMDIQRQKENDYVEALHKYAPLIVYRYIHAWTHCEWLFKLSSIGQDYYKNIKIMHDFTNKVINEKKELRKKTVTQPKEQKKEDDIGKKKPKAFLDLLLDLNESGETSLSLTEMREHVDTFMFGGHDTTGVAISWALFSLGNYPEIQKKVHEELDDVFGDSDEPADKQQLSQLKYLERVIKESLRINPSAPSISRLVEQDVVIDGYTIPRGVTINIDIYQQHHDPEIWENPDEFDPDRFLPENSKGRHAYAFVPFSAGPRNCIGQKLAMLVLKIALASVLRKWTVVSELKPKEVKATMALVMTPPDEILNIKFTPRKKV